MLVQSIGVILFVWLVFYMAIVGSEQLSLKFIVISLSAVMLCIGGLWLLLLWLVVVGAFYVVLKM